MLNNPNLIQCPYDNLGGLACVREACENCGFNPAVSRKRLLEIKDKLRSIELAKNGLKGAQMRTVSGMVMRGIGFEEENITLYVCKNDLPRIALGDANGNIIMIPLELCSDLITIVKDVWRPDNEK